MGTYITFPELFILIPLFTGLISFFLPKNNNSAKNFAMLSCILTLAVVVVSLCYTGDEYFTWNNASYIWLKYIGSTYYVGLDGTGRMLALLTGISFPLILSSTYYKDNLENKNSFFGLMLLAQAGLMGVFCAFDALTFYFYWELALIPVYFLSSGWGGPNKIKTTFKFFVYTFAGSLLMLLGIIYVYLHTGPRLFEDGTQVLHSFSLHSFYLAQISGSDQLWLFWLFFVAFAIKMPIFPFHTWQPDTYDQSPTSVTMVLSGIMVKMGLLGVLRWLIPMFGFATEKFADTVMILSIIGIIYASCIAIVQDNLKKLVAYSSIAHIGLMCAAIFSNTSIGIQGSLIQMFNHGINIIAMWMVVDLIEKKTGTKKISQLGGMAKKAPSLVIALVIIALANIALPMTNAFIGEFMMFAGIWQHNIWFASIAAISIILAAVYTLNMIQKIFYGEPVALMAAVTDINLYQKIVFAIFIILIFIMGVYPQPMLELTKSSVGPVLGLK